MTIISWTDERTAELKKLWSDGLSANDIAKSLGGVTRNAVIGKIHRSNLSGRKKLPPSGPPRTREPKLKPEPTLKPRPKPRAQILAEVLAAPVAVADIAVSSKQRVSLLELTPATCHWPVGDPAAADFHFCGGKAVASYPYCAHHCRVAYQPTANLRRIKPYR